LEYSNVDRSTALIALANSSVVGYGLIRLGLGEVMAGTEAPAAGGHWGSGGGAPGAGKFL